MHAEQCKEVKPMNRPPAKAKSSRVKRVDEREKYWASEASREWFSSSDSSQLASLALFFRLVAQLGACPLAKRSETHGN